MKRILIFSLAYFPHVGGAEIAIKEITNRISRDDISFDLITLRFDKNLPLVEMIGNVRVYRIVGFDTTQPTAKDMIRFPLYLNKILYPLLAAIGAYRLHKENRYDGFWAMMSYMALPIVLLRFIGVRLPYVLTLQEGDPYEVVFKRWYIRPFSFLLAAGFRHARVIQPLSTYLKAWATKMGYRGPIEVVPNAVDTKRFEAPVEEKALDALKIEVGKKMGEVILITTSRLVHKNGVDDVIRALPQLPSNVRFLVLGTGTDEEKLKALAKKEGVEERVTFLGHVSQDKLPCYLHLSDIFIRPSRSEGFGNSFIEAMAAGLPVVATQEGGIADFLFDEKRNPNQPITGYAVDRDSPAQIVEVITRIMNEPEQVRAVVQTAQVLVREKYDWSLIAKLMREKVFARLFEF